MAISQQLRSAAIYQSNDVVRQTIQHFLPIKQTCVAGFVKDGNGEKVRNLLSRDCRFLLGSGGMRTR
jgi:hypothetical protein